MNLLKEDYMQLEILAIFHVITLCIPVSQPLYLNLKQMYLILNLYVTQDHKTSHKGNFFKIEIYTSKLNK